MSPKRNLLTMSLLELPWWISAIVAIVCYAVFRYVLPNLFATDTYLDAVASSLRITGTLFAGLFAAIAVVSALRLLLHGRPTSRKSK